MKKSRIAVIVLAGVVAIVIFFMQREVLSDNLNLNSIEKEVLSKRTKAYKGKNTDDFLSVSKSDFGENIKKLLPPDEYKYLKLKFLQKRQNEIKEQIKVINNITKTANKLNNDVSKNERDITYTIMAIKEKELKKANKHLMYIKSQPLTLDYEELISIIKNFKDGKRATEDIPENHLFLITHIWNGEYQFEQTIFRNIAKLIKQGKDVRLSSFIDTTFYDKAKEVLKKRAREEEFVNKILKKAKNINNYYEVLLHSLINGNMVYNIRNEISYLIFLNIENNNSTEYNNFIKNNARIMRGSLEEWEKRRLKIREKRMEILKKNKKFITKQRKALKIAKSKLQAIDKKCKMKGMICHGTSYLRGGLNSEKYYVLKSIKKYEYNIKHYNLKDY